MLIRIHSKLSTGLGPIVSGLDYIQRKASVPLSPPSIQQNKHMSRLEALIADPQEEGAGPDNHPTAQSLL